MSATMKALKTEKFWRPSFTLVELMISIAIIGIMAGMILYTLAGAQRDAYVARTQGTIKKLNDIILTKWEEYRYRAARINLPDEALIPKNTAAGWQVPLSAMEGARVRMIALRDLMRMEMPDRYSDLLYPPVPLRVGLYTGDGDTSNDSVLDLAREVPGQYQAYRRKLIDESSFPLAARLQTNPYPAPPAGPTGPIGSLRTPYSVTNQSAECLYQIVAASSYQGGSALEFFRPSEIGDTDNDSLPEFIDAWGRPISWIRWPAGYYWSLIGDANAPMMNSLNDPAVSTPDPMDPLKTDWRWSTQTLRMLVPLIVSAGADGEFDIAFDFDSTNNNAACIDPPAAPGAVRYATSTFAGTSWTYFSPDPYVTITQGSNSSMQVGQLVKSLGDLGYNYSDNITNHDLIMQ